MPSARITVPPRFHLRTTSRALGVGTFDDGSWWWSTSTPEGHGTIRLFRSGETAVEAEAWGDGGESLIGRLPHLVGSTDTGFDVIPAALRDLAARHPGLRLGSTRAMYESVARSVLGQQVTTSEAKASLRSLISGVGTQAPGPRPDIGTFPAPDVLARLGYHDLHRFGIERKRATTLIEVARRAKRLEEALDMAPADAVSRLSAIRGIGPWTIGFAMGEAYGDTDAVPIGDFHLPNTIAWALAGEDRADDDRMLELLEPYRPHRRRVVLMIKFSGITAPKYGPRSPVRKHL